MEQLQNVPLRKRTSNGRKRIGFLGPLYEYLDYEHLPDWMKDNDLILTYYRPQMSFTNVLYTMTHLHNETINIWTHFFGFILSISFSIFWWSHDIAFDKKIPLFIFILSMMYTLGVSTIAHLFYIIGPRTNLFVWKLDHLGIVVGCTGAFVPVCMYCFDIVRAWTYIGITTSLAIIIATVTLSDKFHAPKFRVMRFIIQSLFALWSQVPLVNAMIQCGNIIEIRNALLQVYCAIALCILGGVIFTTRITEKRWNVDIIGSSHNIMHIMIMTGHIVFFLAGRTLVSGCTS